MGRGPKETLLQRRHTDGQEVHAKRLNTANYQRNANQNYKEITSHQLEWPSSKNLQTINAGDGMKKREPYTAAAAAESLQSCLTLCDRIDGAAHQAPPSLGFSRQEH